jgi:hypothetical protein
MSAVLGLRLDGRILYTITLSEMATGVFAVNRTYCIVPTAIDHTGAPALTAIIARACTRA